MNRLSLARRTQIIVALVEGNSIRSTERITDTHRDTVMRLMVEVGDGCRALMDQEMRRLPCKRVQVDEIWAYVGKKQRQVTRHDDRREVGDQWTFVAIDADTKLVPVLPRRKAHEASMRWRSWAIFPNASPTASSFRPTPSTHMSTPLSGHSARMSMMGRPLNFTKQSPPDAGRYSPPKVVRAERTLIAGSPDEAHISTSYIERQNLTMRMCTAPVYPPDERLFKEVRERSRSDRPCTSRIKLCSHAWHLADDAGYGGETQFSAMVAGGIGGSDVKMSAPIVAEAKQESSDEATKAYLGSRASPSNDCCRRRCSHRKRTSESFAGPIVDKRGGNACGMYVYGYLQAANDQQKHWQSYMPP